MREEKSRSLFFPPSKFQPLPLLQHTSLLTHTPAKHTNLDITECHCFSFKCANIFTQTNYTYSIYSHMANRSVPGLLRGLSPLLYKLSTNDCMLKQALLVKFETAIRNPSSPLQVCYGSALPHSEQRLEFIVQCDVS